MRTRAWRATALVCGLGVSPAWAAEGAGGGLSLWTFIFLGFGALIVAFQAVPALVLFGAMLRSLFGRRAAAPEVTGETPKGT